MEKLIKGSLASKNEIAQKVDEIVAWINENEKKDGPEEADRAEEKLKAWQRLKAKGFVWQGWEETAMDNGMCIVGFQIPENNWDTDVVKDLDELFSEEEE